MFNPHDSLLDFPDLEFVRSDVDPSTVKPIDTRELVRVVNEYLLLSADQLNSFCADFEEHILTLETRIDRFERQLLLLERKLEDIPSLSPPSFSTFISNPLDMDNQVENYPASAELVKTQGKESICDKNEEHTGIISTKVTAKQVTSTAELRQSDLSAQDQSTSGTIEEPSVANKMKAKDHLVYGKYFKMLRMGVPDPAVRQKMRSEGIDPAFLDEPDKLVQEEERRECPREDDTSSFSSASEDSFA